MANIKPFYFVTDKMNGLIIQWGRESTSPTSFPVAFTNNCIVTGHQASTYNANADYPRFPYDITTTQFKWNTGRGTMNWIAIGY